MDGQFGLHGGVPDYSAIARQLEAFSRELAAEAAATGDGKLDAVARRLRERAAEIHDDLAGLRARRQRRT